LERSDHVVRSRTHVFAPSSNAATALVEPL